LGGSRKCLPVDSAILTAGLHIADIEPSLVATMNYYFCLDTFLPLLLFLVSSDHISSSMSKNISHVNAVDAVGLASGMAASDDADVTVPHRDPMQMFVDLS